MTDTPPIRGDEARDAVAAVLRDQKERAERRVQAELETRPKGQGPAQTVMAMALAGLTLWVWIFPPSIVRPPPPPPLPPPLVDAELRLTVYQAVLVVERYLERTGALPDDLLEVFDGPEDTEGLTYERLGAQRFRLTGVRGDLAVLYETGDSASAFVAGARRIVEGVR